MNSVDRINELVAEKEFEKAKALIIEELNNDLAD